MSRRKAWAEGPAGGQPLLIRRKPAICWALRGPSSPTCQLHTIEFLGTVAAMALHTYRARQRVGSGGGGCGIQTPLCGRRWPPLLQGPGVHVDLLGVATSYIIRAHPQPRPPPRLTEASLLGPSQCMSPQVSLSSSWQLWPSSSQNSPPAGRLTDRDPCWSRAFTCKGCYGHVSTSPERGVRDPNETVAFGAASP